jgi:hypothetical protein
MEYLFATIALALPVLLGSLWLNQFVPPGGNARTALVWGNGTLLGLFLIPQLMRGMDALGIALSFGTTAALCVSLIAVAVALQISRRSKRATATPMPSLSHAMPASHRALFVFLLALIALRIVTLGLEVMWRPLFPWDATTHWATKAKVWFEYKSIVPFVSKEQWLALGGVGSFTDMRPGYPPAVPLLQVYMNLAMGEWNTSLMNLPWLLCFGALAATFFGQLRWAGVSPTIALVFTYFLISMPLLNTHVALAGYADLFLAASYCAGLMAWQGWVMTRHRWQLALAVFFALYCTLIKDEGLIWSLTFVFAAAFAMMSRRETAKLCLLSLLLLILMWLLLPKDLVVAGHPLNHLTPKFHPEGVTGILKSVWLHDNWHLFGYLLLVMIPLGLVMRGSMTRAYLGVSGTLAAAVGAFLFLFLFTGFGLAAADFTGVGRLSIQLAPGLLYLCALLCHEMFTRKKLFSPKTAVSGT